MEIPKNHSPMRVAVVDDEPIACREIKKGLLRRTDFDIETFPDGESALKRMQDHSFDLILCDLKLPGIDGMTLLRTVKKRFPETQVIMITGHGSVDVAVQAIQSGAFHFVIKPVKTEELTSLSQRALETVRLIRETSALKKALFTQSREQYLIGHSPAMQKVMALIKKICSLNCNVLIMGESGTGKELTARALHFLGERRENPFIGFSCVGFTDELIANELFGHEKGAFTGAVDTKIGLLESSDKGTIFLDEVGLMPLTMQVKLLRFIQERSLIRVGGVTPIPVDVRLIAAGNSDLKQEVEQKKFREDLYFRLNVVSITLPPLRDRKEDIPLLIHHFIERYNHRFKKQITGIAPDALKTLKNYPFPGNVRELENIVERAVALSEKKVISCKDLPGDILDLTFTSLEDDAGWKSLEEVERDYILKVLEKTGFQKNRAADILKLPRTTLWRKMKSFHLD
ncbi:sigma-54-dependent transcriptional regulator [Desulfospira joergensenii]|uniref:sigma-54-dependent transcriptional regulator n=1 Tax=Desulfospira joergensenii TaxID=53329 RepID=UPI0003B730EB|nr:sigma-54 dependent transcriptional regulator [Desulfospira joergensenii]